MEILWELFKMFLIASCVMSILAALLILRKYYLFIQEEKLEATKEQELEKHQADYSIPDDVLKEIKK